MKEPEDLLPKRNKRIMSDVKDYGVNLTNLLSLLVRKPGRLFMKNLRTLIF